MLSQTYQIVECHEPSVHFLLKLGGYHLHKTMNIIDVNLWDLGPRLVNFALHHYLS